MEARARFRLAFERDVLLERRNPLQLEVRQLRADACEELGVGALEGVIVGSSCMPAVRATGCA